MSLFVRLFRETKKFILDKCSPMVFIMYMLTACGVNDLDDSPYTPNAIYPIRLTPQEASALFHANVNSVLILDVRTLEEFEQAHIENAWHIPHDEIETQSAVLIPDKSQIIFVYCRSGNRSNVAAHALVTLGYARVYDIGGMYAWLG